jgi:hypothetical protein
MKRIISLAAAMIFAACMPAFATIINVPGDYPTIQEGINGSSNGDTVLVQPDTYMENVNFNGRNIVLGSMFLVTGDTSYISSTIIDGDSLGSVVTFQSYEDSTAQIVGFTIQNGYNNNYAGGIFCDYAGPTIRNNRIIDNVGFEGGGIYCEHSDAKIRENFIGSNIAGDVGGGICFWYSYDPIAENNVIAGDSAQFGGGIGHWSSTPTIKNNVMIDNTAEWNGGGIFCRGYNSVITNNIIWGNSAPTGPQIDIFSGSPIITYCDVQGGWSGTGNIDADPLFRDVDNGDYHLQDSIDCGDPHYSPCIDVGDPSISDSLIDCDWGLGELRSDMGAFAGGAVLPDYALSCEVEVVSPYVPCREGIVLFDISVTNVGALEYHEIVGELQPTIGDCATGTTFDLDIYRTMTTNLVPGGGFTGYYFFYAGDNRCSIPQLVALNVQVGDALNSYQSECCDEFFFYRPWGREWQPNINWNNAEWGERDSNMKISLPAVSALHQCYPNPFNITVNIPFDLAGPDRVNLSIYNLLGQRMETLIDGAMDAGHHSVSWDASAFSSGIYFYRLTTGDREFIKRMTLVK